jgi:hypothetical protein
MERKIDNIAKRVNELPEELQEILFNFVSPKVNRDLSDPDRHKAGIAEFISQLGSKDEGLKMILEEEMSWIVTGHASFKKSLRVKLFSGGTVTLRGNTIYVEAANPFIGRIERSTHLKIEPHLDTGKPSWWEESEHVIEIENALRKLGELVNQETFKTILNLVSDDGKFPSLRQSKTFHRYLASNELFFKSVLSTTKLLSLLPLSYLNKIAKKHNERLRRSLEMSINAMTADGTSRTKVLNEIINAVSEPQQRRIAYVFDLKSHIKTTKKTTKNESKKGKKRKSSGNVPTTHKVVRASIKP